MAELPADGFEEVSFVPTNFALANDEHRGPRMILKALRVITTPRRSQPLRMILTKPPLVGTLWWRLVRSDRQWALGSIVAAIVMLLAGGLAGYGQSKVGADMTSALAGTQRDQADARQRAARQTSDRAMQPRPWWSQLPEAVAGERSAAEQLSADALAMAPKLGVQVQRLTFAPPSQVAGSPYRGTAVQIEVRGRYADIKRWIGELLARRANTLAVKSIDWRRGGVDAATGAAPSATEVSIDLRLFERAVAS